MCVCALHDWETGLLGSLRSYDGFCNESVTSKLNFMVDFAFCDHSILVILYERGGVTFRLLSTDSFDVKAENERYTSASWSCRHNLKYQNNCNKNVPHVQHNNVWFSLFNQSNH